MQQRMTLLKTQPPLLRSKVAPDHSVAVWETAHDLRRRIDSFIGEGADGEALLVLIVERSVRGAVEARLIEHGVDGMILNAEDTLPRFFVDGLPDPELFAGFAAEVVKESASGWQGVRVLDQMVGLLAAQRQWQAVLALEALWNDLLAVRDASLLCLYPPGAFPSGVRGEALARMVCGCHDYADEMEMGRLLRSVSADRPEEVEPDARHLLDDTLERSDRRLLAHRLADAAPVGLIAVDMRHPDQPVVYANRAFEQMTGFPVAEVLGRNCRFLNCDRDENQLARLRSAIRRGETFQTVLLNRRRDGTSFWNELTLTPLVSSSGRVTHYIGVQRDITATREGDERIQHLAYHDPVTGALNRQGLRRAFTGGIRGALHIDIDRFRQVNRLLGPTGGDELLRGVVARLSSALPESARLARLEGDQFAVLLADEAIEEVVQRVRSALRTPVCAAGSTLMVTVAIGGATTRRRTADFDELLAGAELAVREARRQGGDTFVAHGETLTLREHQRARLEHDMKLALDRGEFFLQYQPIVAAMGGRITGLEALVRWRQASGRVVPPGEFVPAAEESGLIIPLGIEILRQACECRRRIGLDWDSDAPVAVNVSGRQFSQFDFVQRVMNTLGETGLDPRLLQLEITETAAISAGGVESLAASLRPLLDIGVKLSIDDFGTGYSSIAYVRKVPASKLKIDRSFVDHVAEDPRDAGVVQSIISLARAYGMATVAEGVERREQADFLRAAGCSEMQGYLFSAAVDSEALPGILRTRFL
jgi:diguanylate cyclase (GGDEF)-like protein/PAS domain S-box-containing protein